ncbi:MAG: DUF58 domain-containing protein [Chloroflexi bacterium]|nr:DUF58 domain-containing protein [Chloroflexota bacterium]
MLASATILLLFSMAIPWQPLFQLAMGLYVLAALCLLWILNSLWGLQLRRPSPVRRGQVGQTIHDYFELANWFFLPKFGVEIRDHSTLPGHHGNSVVNLGPRSIENDELDTVSELRGQYTLGPSGAMTSDPFGLFSLERRIGPSHEVLIYPETVDLGTFSVPGTLIAEGARHRRASQIQTLDPAGTRPYVYGDSVRRIHWASTAHAGQLMVKEYEFTPAADVWLFLDLERRPHVGSGMHSTEEYAVTTAASLAAHYLKGGRAVGLVCSGRTREVLPAERGQHQLIRILELLAIVRANGRTPLHEVLWVDRTRMHRTATAIAITPSLDEGWAGVMAQLQHAGTHTAAVLVEASTFGHAPSATMQVAALTSAAVPTYLVKKSSSMARAVADGLLQGVADV